MSLKDQLSDFEIGASLLTVYFGFKKSLKDLGNKYYSTFVFDNSIRTQKDIKTNNSADFSKRSFTFIDYSQIDSGLAPDGKSVGVICTIDYLSDWKNLDKDQYKKQKERIANIFKDRLEVLIPGIKEEIDYCEVGTSKSVKRFTLNPGGAVYGYAQTPERMSLPTPKVLDHLHFASAWTKTGGGFSGAIYSGYLCAFDILRGKL